MRTTIAVTLTVIALVVMGSPGPGSESNAASGTRRGATIVVDVTGDRGRAPTKLLGANQQFDRNGRGLWDPNTDAPVPAAVTGAMQAGIQSMRFPGGTVANLYDWKRAIGPERGCQATGPHRPGFEGRAVTSGLGFGPDEFMRFLDEAGAKPNIMVPFVTETPGDAADWVEYMNSPAGTEGNPNGGTDWAEVRADNGHPEPYRVRWWEIGNEQHHHNSRYWMSHKSSLALRQYAFGGSRVVSGENLGKQCAHPTAGIPSDGAASQTFEALYPPVDPESFRVEIGGTGWTQVPDLSAAGPEDQVYTLDAEHGRVTFGNGTNGAIPSPATKVSASYRSVHQGYFAFARRMREVDPSIQVCATWAAAAFNRLVRREYDCLASHAIVPLTTAARPRWSGQLEGHDWMMRKTGAVQDRIREARRTMPPSTPLLLTEFVAMHGDARAFPAWGTSVSHAVFMSSLWAAWLNMRIPLGNGAKFTGGSGSTSVLGGSRYTFTAHAVTRMALAPMFSAGGELLATRIERNPVRHTPSARGSYAGLTVAATRGHGAVRLLVVNRLPRQSVTSRIRLDGRRAGGTASIRSVTGSSFKDWNQPDSPPSVVLDIRSRTIGETGFRYEFPAASTTVFRIPLR